MALLKIVKMWFNNNGDEKLKAIVGLYQIKVRGYSSVMAIYGVGNTTVSTFFCE